MPATNVSINIKGVFNIPSSRADRAQFRVSAADECPHGWNVSSKFDGADQWNPAGHFESLDDALSWSVAEAGGDKDGFGVTMPCGAFFSRPGRIKAEDVMAAHGWVYVTHILGYSGKDFPLGTPQSDIVAYFEDLVEDTSAVLGEVYRCTVDENDQTLWVADIEIPAMELMNTASIPEVCLDMFEEEGIPCLNDFQYFTHTNVHPHTAAILSFEEHAAARSIRAA